MRDVRQPDAPGCSGSGLAIRPSHAHRCDAGVDLQGQRLARRQLGRLGAAAGRQVADDIREQQREGYLERQIGVVQVER